MKMKPAHLRILFLVFIAGTILSSCKKDSAATDPIIGTWTAGTTTVSAMVGTKTLTQYYIDVVGATAEEAAALTALFDAFVQQNFTGTIQFKADNTYTMSMGGTSDSGTWSLNSDRSKLTIVSTTDGPIVFDVAELTSSRLHLQITETTTEDLNGDNIPETITVSLDLNLTK